MPRVNVGDTLWTGEITRNRGRAEDEPFEIVQIEKYGKVLSVTPKRMRVKTTRRTWRKEELVLRYQEYEDDHPHAAVGNTSTSGGRYNRGRQLYPSREAAIAAIRDSLARDAGWRERAHAELEERIAQMREEVEERITVSIQRAEEINAQLEELEG